MDELFGWPAPVTDFLCEVHGEPLAVERLGGMSVAQVYRVRFAQTSVVVKVSSKGRESCFYEQVAARLREIGVPIPQLEWSAHLPDGHWLILEDIPEPLPLPHRDQWRPDPRMVAVLARLHATELPVPAEVFEFDDRQWTDTITEAALSFFPRDIARALVSPLRALQEEGQHVTDASCWIAGDPNPTNWGVRVDGSIALYDWELFRRGTPAVDLAILVVGLGGMPKYRELAACYLKAWQQTSDDPPWSTTTLARDIALAKVWSITHFLSVIVTRTGEGRIPERLRGQLAEYVPPWVRSLIATPG